LTSGWRPAARRFASLDAASDHIAHVRTQLPYALLAGAVAVVAFAITGALL
jgi:Na+/H+ antiporter NhaC